MGPESTETPTPNEVLDTPVSEVVAVEEPSTAKAEKVLYVITKAAWGGAQRYVYDLAVSMSLQGYDVAVAYGTSGLLVDKLKSANIRTIELPHVKRDVAMFGSEEHALHPRRVFESFSNEFKALRALIHIFKEERPDILHLNSSKVGVLGTLAGRVARVPKIIFTSHGWAFNEKRPWWQKIVFYKLYALTLWLSHTTICVSQAIKHDMAWLPRNKMVVVRLGIDAPQFYKRIDARKKIGEVGDRIVLGMLAELHPTKRVEDAILALKELKESYPNLMLVVFGEGDNRAELSELVERLRLADSVMLRGFVADAATLLPAFDIFLMPSRTEALGYAAIEAGYAELPVIASRVGGLPEIIRHKETGLLVPAHNPHTLSRAIRTLLDESDYATLLGKRLGERVRSQFTKERMVTETEEVYKS